MDFALPADLIAYLAQLDAFIEAEIKPLEQQDDNIRFFDHRREWARTDYEHGGLPRREWELLLREASMRADKAGHWRFSAPKKYGGKDGSNLWMAVIRDKFAAKGLGLHNDLQNEHSIVGNFPFVAMFESFGTEAQQQEFILGGFARNRITAFGLTEPDHGSDATQCEMLRLMIYKTAWDMDNMPHEAIESQLSDKISMCNYWANRLVCEAADRAMQVHGGIGYSRHKPFEHIFRHHRRYRITEGSEEIQMRKVAAYLFGYLGPRKKLFADL